jgi:hypothetical protein
MSCGCELCWWLVLGAEPLSCSTARGGASRSCGVRQLLWCRGWGGGVEYKSKVLGATLVLQICEQDDDHVEGVLKSLVACGESWAWTCKDAAS